MSLVAGLLAAFFPPRCEPIAELTPGRSALVRGKVVPRDLIDSTLTGERCVYYRYSVDQWRAANVAGLGFANEGHWAMTRHDEAIVEFYLQDEHGDRVIISPQRVSVQRARVVEPTAVDMGIVGQRGQELMICDGDEIEVQGLVAVVADLFDHDRDYRTTPTRMMLCAPEGETLQIRIVGKQSF